MNPDPAYRPIRKPRYCLTSGNQYFEIDIYPFWEDRAILEIKLCSEEETVNIPRGIQVIREVTDDPDYKSAALAKM